MNKFKFFSKKDKELHLTTGKRIKIIKIAKIIQKLLLQRNIKVKISQSKKNDQLQNNKNNIPNKFFFNFWKPKHTIEEGIDKIIDYYDK